MKPQQQMWLPSLAFPSPPGEPAPDKANTDEAPEQRTWNWHLEPELWARSIRKQLDGCLNFLLEENIFDTQKESKQTECRCRSKEHKWNCPEKQKEIWKSRVELELRDALELLLAELRTLMSGVLQDGGPAAWRYLRAVLGLLPPYRTFLVGHLDLLPLLEQLYCWAPKVQSRLHVDLLDALKKAFPPDRSLLRRASHVDCYPRRKPGLHQGLPCPACSSTRWDEQQKKELATWLRPLTLPELQRCLGIVGAEVALQETQWMDGLSLLPLALATNIPVQYKSGDADLSKVELVRSGKSKSLFGSGESGKEEEEAFQKKSLGFLTAASILDKEALSVMKMDKYLIQFLYLNVAPGRHFRPYDLVVVPHNKVNPEYYVLSPFGILHVHPEEGNEILTMGTWHRHTVLWHELQRIPFFKYCLLRKAFTHWKKTMRQHGLHRTRTFLRNHLLLAVPHFGAALLHISRLLQELHSVSWLPKEPDRCYELPDLQKALAKENHKALCLLRHCLYLCISILHLVHEDTYHMQQGLQERVQNWNWMRKGQGSIYLQRVLCRQLEKKLRQAETWLLKLGKFARVVDYMICQTVVSILEDDITSFVADILQAPRQNPFLSSQLVFNDRGQMCPVPSVETIIQTLTKSLQSVKTSALQTIRSTESRTTKDFQYSPENEDDAEFLIPKFHGKPSDAVRFFCGPNIGLVWPWKAHTISHVLEVRGHRLRGQYLPLDYDKVQEDLDNNGRIQQALTTQQTLLEDMLQEVQEFCEQHQWVADIYTFLQTWDPGKIADLKGHPIKEYIVVMREIKDCQARVARIPVQLLTKGKLLLLSCHELRTDLESKLNNLRNEILTLVQNECWSRNQQLMTELTEFLRVFQTMNTDIHAIAQCSKKLNEASEQYSELEERMEYVRSLHELIRNHCGPHIAENEALDIALLDIWETFQSERIQASEFLLSKRYAIVPKLQQLMAADLAELEGLLEKALSGPFMDPSQDQRSTEQQLHALEQQFLRTVSHLTELHTAYVIFTGDEIPIPMPARGTQPIVQQQRIWHLYCVISKNFSQWKCMAFVKFNLSTALEKTDGWLTEAARLSTTLDMPSPVLQRCMRMLEEFRSFLPLLAKLGSLQLQNPNCQSLFRALGLGSLHNIELLTLGQLLNCPLLEFTDRINQVWQHDKERIHAQENLNRLQQYWEAHQLRLLNFILHVPYKPPASEQSKRQVLHSVQWEVVSQDSGTFLLADYSSLQDSIQDSLQTLFKILAIQKSGDFHKTALEWVTIMYSLGSLLEVWVDFQQKWIFLNKVLHEMKIQFPNADVKARFKVMDDQYRTLMRISIADPWVLSLIVPNAKRSPYFQGQQLQKLLQAGSVELESIIMALENVLYEVCANFPRLFFLSNSELVALLAAPLEECEAQPWVQRCFPHISAVKFKPSPTEEKSKDDQDASPNKQAQVDALAVLGVGGEEVTLQEPLPLHPDLPKWLASLNKHLRLVMVSLLQNCVFTRLSGDPSLGETLKKPQQRQVPPHLNVLHWLDSLQVFPWQCVLIAEEVVWRAETEEALLQWGTLGMTSMHVQKLEILVKFIQVRRNQGRELLPTPRQTSLLSALVVMAVSHRDIAQLLERNHVSDLSDFHWARQIKYYLGSPHLIPQSPLENLRAVASVESSGSAPACWVEVLGRSFLYNYEYLGPRLGPLPRLLYERPVLVLLLALQEVACGTLLGRDGCCKTETVNNLAWALGRQLVTLPCLPQIESSCLSNYLNGALQGGAWLLLKTVHQLPPGLLSALGQRLAEVHYLYAPLYQEAAKNICNIDPTRPQLLGTGFFEKHQVSMNLGYGCFLTLRSLGPSVPANLHLLLRPVALALPDLQQVAELTFLGAGVRDASRMAARLAKLLSLEQELVSGTLPSRFPLLKQILGDMIQTLSVNTKAVQSQQTCNLASTEEAALLRALLRSPLFSILDGMRLQNLRELLSEIFPNASSVLTEPVPHRLLASVVVEELQQVGLLPNPSTLECLEQLSQALGQTSGILLLGPAGSGKTACWNSLFKIQNRLAAMEQTSSQGFQSVEITHLYPSALSSQEFLGWLEGPSWHCGIFPKLLRAAPQCQSTSPKEQTDRRVGIQQWIICDGACSTAWLDSVTCLLGDPPELSLPNGQQIALPPHTSLLMEMADAAAMSPTLVGRCSIVWCGGEQTWQCMLTVLVASLPHEYHLQQQTITEFNHLAEVFVPAMFRFLIRKGASSVLQVHGHQAVCPGVAEVTSLTRILQSLLGLHLHPNEEKSHSTATGDFSDSGIHSFKPSKSSSLNSDHVQNKQRDHLLAVSSFLFAIIWGFGAHLPSRLWPVFNNYMRSSFNCIPNYPEPPASALVFDLHINPENGTLIPFSGQYLTSHIRGTLGSFHPSAQTEQLLYMVELLVSNGHPVLLVGEAATGKSAFMEVLVEPRHPYIHSPIHPAFSSAQLRSVLSRGIQGQTQVSLWPARYQDIRSSLLFLMEDLHLAASDAEKSCQPVLETLRQAMEGTIYANKSLELQTLQPIVNFLATATVPGYSERPLCPRLFRLFTVLAFDSITQDTLLSRHAPTIQAWLERFPCVEREYTLARALVRASMEAWDAVRNCFMPSPLHPHYHFSLHSVSHLLGSLQMLPTRTGSQGFLDSANHQDHLQRVSGLRGSRLAIMMSMRCIIRLWMHEAQRTFCDRLDSPRERSQCARLLLEVTRSVFCAGPICQKLDDDYEEEEEDRVPEVESEGEMAQWEDLSNSDSDTEEEDDPYGLQATGPYLGDPSLAPSMRSISRETSDRASPTTQQDNSRVSSPKFSPETSENEQQKVPRRTLVSPLLLSVLLLHAQEKPSDVVFSQELIMTYNSETPNLYLERQWENLEKQLSATASQLTLNPYLAQCHTMTQHVARLVRVLGRSRQHGLLLSEARGTGRRIAIILASSICQAHFFQLPCGPEEAILQCLRDASWHAGILGHSVALLVPENTDVTILHRLVALATSGTFPEQYTEVELDNIEDKLPKESFVKHTVKKEVVLHRFYRQVCNHLHMFFLMGDDQAQRELPPTLYLRLLQLTIASVDRYEPWDQASLAKIAQCYLENVHSLPLDEASLKCPDIKALIPSMAKVMALIHLSSSYYHHHLCPALPLITPKTFLEFLDIFVLMQEQMILKMRSRAQRIHIALQTLNSLIDCHSTQTNLVSGLEQQIKDYFNDVTLCEEQLEHSKVLYKQQVMECQQQENLIENLIRQRDALQAQYEAFLDQMGQAFLGPLSQLQVADFEEIRSYRAPPEPVIRVTDALCDLFHHETGWANAKQLLCTEDFYQDLVFFPKEKLTDLDLIKLNQALKAPGMSKEALRSVSVPAANLATWLWAVLHYGLAQRRGLPTGLLLRQVEATLAREQIRLGQYQFRAHELLEQTLTLNKKLESARASYNYIMDSLSKARDGDFHKWPLKSALLTPMHMWSTQLQKLREHCMTVYGDAVLCAAAFTYLGPFPPQRRQELLDKWLSLCQGFEESLGPDDIAQAQKEKPADSSPKPITLLPTRFPFRILSLLSYGSEQQHWDRSLKPQAKSARLAGLLLRSHMHYCSHRWPLLLDPSNQAIMWLDPLVPAPTENRVNQDRKYKWEELEKEDDNDHDEDSEEDKEEANREDGGGGGGSKKRNVATDQREEKAGEQKTKGDGKEQERLEKDEVESLESEPASETPHPLSLTLLSGADPELGPQLQQAAARGVPVLLTNMELGLECQELEWLLSREQLSPPEVLPGFCLYLSTTIPLHALEKGCELLKGLNVLDLGLNMEILEEQILHEILCKERPELEIRWKDLKIRALDTFEAKEAAEEHLMVTLLLQSQRYRKPAKFLRDMVRTQAKICQLYAECEDLEEQKLEERLLWIPYRQVALYGMALVEALSPLQNVVPLFCMSPENWLAVIKRALDSMKPHDTHHGEDLASHLLQLKRHLGRQLLGSIVAALGLAQVPLVGALGALALLQVAKKAPKLEKLALWPGLATSPSTNHSKQVSGVVRPAWIGPRAWQECGRLELLPPFVGLRASLAGHSSMWQEYLLLSSTVLGPAPGPTLEPLSLLQKLILWRVLRPNVLAAALADLTTSLLGRPLDENLEAPTSAFEHSQATQPTLILLPPPGHPTATLHPVTIIRELAANHKQGQKHVQVVALGSEAWDPVAAVISTLCQAMSKGHWLVLDNCHLMPRWPRELLRPLLGLLGGAKVVSDLELELPAKNVVTVHEDFRLWLIVSTEASASLPAVLTQHSTPVFWDHSLELGRILIDSVELAQQGHYKRRVTQSLPLLFLHGLLLHRQLYGMKLQAHRGRWSQVTLTHVLQTQDELWASLSNPGVAMQELAVFYGGPVSDWEDRKALISLTQSCLYPSNRNWFQPHTPEYLLANLMPSPELGELDALGECKAQMRLLPNPSEPALCGLSEGPKAWLLRRQSRSLLSALQLSSPAWVPLTFGGPQRKERRLRQRVVQAKRRLAALQAALADGTGTWQWVAPRAVLGPNASRPLEGFLETEVLLLRQLAGTLQRDLDCLLQRLRGEPPCPSARCVAVAHALWTGCLPPPWRSHAPAGPQVPWQWLRQLSRRGNLLIRYVGGSSGENAQAPERIFHLSVFRHPRRLLLALRWESLLAQPEVSSGSGLLQKRRELDNHPLHLQVENGPDPKVPEMGLLLVGLQLQHAQWDPIDGALQDNPSGQPSPLPPVSVTVSGSAQAKGPKSAPSSAGLEVYSCPVYMAGPLGTTKLHSRNILMHLPLPSKLSLATCIQRKVHVCSPTLT